MPPSKRLRNLASDQIGAVSQRFTSCVWWVPSMSSPSIHVVILAAGQGTRMKSHLPKVLHAVPGGPMLDRVIRTAESLSPESLTIVVGHAADAIQSHLNGRNGVQFALQQPQLGTGHALLQTAPLLAGKT